MCEWNRQENKLLGQSMSEPCSLENLGIKCRPETVEACKAAEAVLKEMFEERKVR